MAVLHILKGQNQGQQVPLDQERISLGRNPDCNVVIPVTSVSREHARILKVNGKFFIEDLQSRNGTYVNNQPITARTALKHNDRIRICDFLATFQDNTLPPLPADVVPPIEEEDDGEGSTTVEATLSHSSHMLLEKQPAEKLRAILDISSNLSKTLELDPLLPKIVDSLFSIFTQADRGFIILTQEGTPPLIAKVVKTRRAADESNARFSKSIVRQCLERGEAFLSDDASTDKRVALSQSVLDFRIRSVMCGPLMATEGKAFGVIQLDTQDRSKKFNQEDLKFLQCVCNQASIALENAKMHETLVARELLNRDLKLAWEVQHSFLPSSLPTVKGYDFYALYEPAQEVGGDYYGFIPLANGKVAITVGDVAGKGIPAALLMAKLSSDTRFCLLTESDPARAVTVLNKLLYPHTSPLDRFVTLVTGILDPVAHTVTLASAGHQAPYIYRKADGSIVDSMPKEVPGLPLGMMDDAEYAACTVSLQPGDCLLMFSDGVPDAQNIKNQSFGNEGLRATIQKGHGNARTLGERLFKDVKNFAAGRPQHDDITLVCFSREA
jgi:phosphoserine phosphatase RsbU/P